MEKGPVLVHLIGIAQSLAAFFLVCLATAALLSLAIVALTQMERAVAPVRRSSRRPVSPGARLHQESAADAVSSPGSCTYRPRGQ